MSELEELKRKRQEINARIKELEHKEITFGRAKIASRGLPAFHVTEYYLSYQLEDRDGAKRYQRLAVADDSAKAVVDAIPKIIKDLNGLYNLYKEQEHD